MRTKNDFKKMIKAKLAQIAIDEWAPIWKVYTETSELFTPEQRIELGLCHVAVGEVVMELESDPEPDAKGCEMCGEVAAQGCDYCDTCVANGVECDCC